MMNKFNRDIKNLINKKVKVYDTNLGAMHYGTVIDIDEKYGDVKVLCNDGSPQKICVNIRYVEEAY